MLTQQQLDMRKTGIGGSDVAVILGLSPWRTPLKLWAEKIGKLEAQEASAAMEWGHRLEAPVYQKFKQEHPEYECSYGSGTVRHAEQKHLLATPDAFYHRKGTKGGASKGILEIKTSGQQAWSEVPEYYMMQARHYCYVLNRDEFSFAVLFGGVDYREYGPFWFDPEQYADEILPLLDYFWESVENKDPKFPPSELNELNLLNTVEKGKEADCDNELAIMLGRHRELKDVMDQCQEELKPLRIEIAERMGDASKLVDEDGRTLAVQVQSKDTKVIDTKRLKKEAPELFEKYSKTKAGYRSLRVY